MKIFEVLHEIANRRDNLKKIIFLIPSAIIQFDYNRYGVEYWENKGYCVEIWILRSVVYPHVEDEQELFSGNIKDIRDISIFKKYIKENKNAIYFDWLGGNISPNKYKIRRIMARYKLQFEFFYINPGMSCNTSTDCENHHSWRDRYHRRVKEMGYKRTFVFYILEIFKRIQSKYISSIGYKILSENQPRHLYLSARKAFDNVPLIYRDAPIVYTHATDYENFLDVEYKKKKDDLGINGEYILYVDQGMTNHPDFYKYAGKSIDESVKKDYISRINDFFSMLEKKFNCPVVIAAHPRVDYSQNIYISRKVIKNNTQMLISKAKLVLIMYSTALDYVVLYKKPFIAIEDPFIADILGENTHRNVYDVYKMDFNIEVYNLQKSKINQIGNYIKNYDDTYEQFIRDYIIDDSSNRQLYFWQKVEQTL